MCKIKKMIALGVMVMGFAIGYANHAVYAEESSELEVTVANRVEGSLSESASVVTTVTLNGITYELYSNNTASATALSETPVSNLTISDSVEYNGAAYTVTAIGNNFASGKDVSGSLTLPSQLVTIGYNAFKNCSNLTGNLTLPSSTTSIGDYAFMGCSGFTGDLTIAAPSIGKFAFCDCTGFNGKLSLASSVTTIGNCAFCCCKSLTGDLTIPNGVTYIGDSVFKSCAFNGKLTLPAELTAIGASAFYGCKGFTGNLVIPDTVKSIGNSAFYGCSGFTGTLTIPNSVTSLANSTFYGCKGFTGNLVIPTSITAIGNSAFSGCSGFNGTLTIPNTVTSIGSSAFYGCRGLKGSLTIPGSVTTLGYSAFNGCWGFTGDLIIPSSVTKIDYATFSGCSGLNGTLTITSSVTSIGQSAFNGCSGLNGTLTIPSSVTSIGENAFYGCKGLTGKLTIPSSVTTISDNAFTGCTGFDQVQNDSAGSFTLPEAVGEEWVDNSSGNIVTMADTGNYRRRSTVVGDISYEFYSDNTACAVTLEAAQENGLVIPDAVEHGGKTYTVTRIGENFINGMKVSGQLTLPSSLVSIGVCAFDDCSGLTGNLNLPVTVISIGGSAFEGCSGFTGSLTIPGSVTSISMGAFLDCSGFTGGLTIPASVTYIGDGVFQGCSGFDQVQNDSEVNFTLPNAPEAMVWISSATGEKVTQASTGTYVIKDAVTVDTASLSLGEDIAVNLYIIFNESIAKNGYAKINGVRCEIPMAESDGTYKFSIRMNAKELGDTITLEIYNGSDEPVPFENESVTGSEFTYTIRDYIAQVRAIDDSSADYNKDLLNLVNALDDYGFCAQQYFGYKAPSAESIPTVVSVSISDEYRLTTTGSLPNGVEYIGSSLLLQDRVTVRHYFTSGLAGQTVTVDGVTVTVHNAGDLCYVEVTEIKPVSYGIAHTLKVGDYTMSYSPYTYIRQVNASSSNEDLIRLVNAMYYYGFYAGKYFG